MKKFFLIVLVILIGLQFIPSEIQNKEVDRNIEIKAPEHIMSIFKRSCYDCHSDEVKIPWYASVAPISFTIKRHVDLGRQWLNFSTWENYTEKQKDPHQKSKNTT